MSSAGAGATTNIGVAKIVVMGGIMYAARSWNNEDAAFVHQLRVAYAAIHVICVTLVLYIYYVASQLGNTAIPKAATAASPLHQLIYVPAAAQPFADPAQSKKSYTQIVYSTHVVNTARSLVGSTLFSIAMTCGLHWYKGMVTGLAIQTMLAPLTAWENPLVRAVVLSFFAPKGAADTPLFLAPEHRHFDEKLSLAELDAATDQVVDERGNPVKIPASNRLASNGTTQPTPNASALVPSETAATEPPKSFEDIVLDTWDDGARADVTLLIQAVTAQNVNTPTAEAGWTPLMVVCGLHAIPATVSTAALAQLWKLGANVRAVDSDGWNCFHWALFHGHRGAIEQLISLIQDTKVVAECCRAKDKEQKTPLDIARQEGNDDMVATIQAALGEAVMPSAPNLESDAATEPKKDL